MPIPTRHALFCLSVWITLLIPRISFSQPVVVGPDQPVDAQTRSAVIQELIRQLQTQYVFPKVAAQIGQAIQTELATGDYDRITSSKALADTLTAQMQRISHDKHLRLFYQSKPVQSSGAESKADEQVALEQHGRQINFGFGKPERLPGNIGYLRVDEFMLVELAAQTATVVMTYLGQTNALILDLRHNRGGEPDMVAYLASYFFGPDSVHLNDIVSKGGGSVQSYWTHGQVPGKRYVGKPLYILTSKKTFSAGEEFAYDLQALKRATIVGESTAGGAHSGERVRIGDHFTAFIPVEYAVNPITHTNWEGTGVKPDMATRESQALKAAHLTALNSQYPTASAARKKAIRNLIEQVSRAD